MPITRDTDFPAEAATLMRALNACCDGHSVAVVEMAALNLFSAAVHHGAKLRQISDEQFPAYVAHMAGLFGQNALENWNRKPEATDIPVGDS